MVRGTSFRANRRTGAIQAKAGKAFDLAREVFQIIETRQTPNDGLKRGVVLSVRAAE